MRNVVLASLLVTACGEPIPVDLTKATEPCEEGAKLMTDGMTMVMRDGQLTVVPKEREVQAFYSSWGGSTGGTTGGTTTQASCEGCH
ncbi:MAG: hypothetical protein JXB05_08635 [Myxococcaceae bacterium]|nr:hypothetical protein [Myxococcaceae bacterium]